MNVPDLPTPEIVDAFLHGLLDEAEEAAVRQRGLESEAWKRALAEGRKRQAALHALPTFKAGEALIQATLVKIRRHEALARSRRRVLLGGLSAMASAAATLLVAAYHVAHLETPDVVDLRVRGQSTLLAGSKAALRVQLCSSRDTRPLVDVPVRIELMDAQSDRAVILAEFMTDEHGSGRPRFELPDWNEPNCRLRVTASPRDGEPQVVEERVRIMRSHQVMLTADRPTYQPGQTIRLRALVLRRPEGRPDRGVEVVFEIRDPRSNLVFRVARSASEYGLAWADCELARTIIEGPYVISASVGNVTSRLEVEVRKYVLPRIRVAVEPDCAFYLPSDEIRGQVVAKYPPGNPVADADVVVTIRTARSMASILGRATTRTDADGRAHFALRLDDHIMIALHDDTTPITIEAVVTDSAKQSASRSVERIITRQPIQISVVPEGSVLVPGVVNKVYVLAVYVDGSPVAAAEVVVEGIGTLRTSAAGVATFTTTPQTPGPTPIPIRVVDRLGRIAETIYRATVCADDFSILPDRDVYRGGDTLRLEVVSSVDRAIFLDFLKDDQTLLTDVCEVKNGRGRYELDLGPEWSGTIHLTAHALGRDGRALQRKRVILIRPPSDLVLRTAWNDVYRPGETARLCFSLVDGEGKPARGALSVAGVDETIYSLVHSWSGGDVSRFPFDSRWFASLRPRFPTWSPSIERPSADRAALDRAVFALASSKQALSDGTAADEPVPPRAAQTATALPFSIDTSTGARTLEAFETTRRGWMQWIGIGFGATMASIALLLAVALFFVVSQRWKHSHEAHPRQQIAESAETFDALAPIIAPRRPIWIACGLLTVILAGVGILRPLVLAHLAWLGNKWDGVGSARSEPVDASGTTAEGRTVRDNFPETLVWQPQLLTDDAGKVELDVPLADSITTWRISASAVTKEGQLAAVQTGLKVFQPFFVDVVAPRVLTRGDEIDLPVLVSNHLEGGAQTVAVTVEKADWFELIGEPTHSIEVQPGRMASTSFRIRVRKAGEHLMCVAARNQERRVSDAVRRAIEVVPEGRPVERAIANRLTRDLTVSIEFPEACAPDSRSLLVKFYPSLVSQVLDGIDGLSQWPTACMEQISSASCLHLLLLDCLQQSRRAAPRVHARALQHLQLCYQRLLAFECKGGGFSSQGIDPAQPWLTAQGLRLLVEIQRVLPVDPQLLTRTRRCLFTSRLTDGSWPADAQPSSHGDFAATAYIAWLLLQIGEQGPVVREALAWLAARLDDHAHDPTALALAANAFAWQDADHATTRRALDLLDALRAPRPVFGDDWYPHARPWLTSGAGDSLAVEAAALAVLAQTKAGRCDGIERTLDFLTRSRRASGEWGSTQATTLALRALAAARQCKGEQAAESGYVVRLHDKEVGRGHFTTNEADVVRLLDLTPHLRPGRNDVTIAVDGKPNVAVQVVARHYAPWEAGRPADSLLDFQLHPQRTTMRVDETTVVEATVRCRGPQRANMVLLELPVPPGFDVVSDEFEAWVREGVLTRYSIEPRHITVWLRDPIEPNASRTLRYSLRPRSPARVRSPEAIAYECSFPEGCVIVPPIELTVR